MSIEKPVLGVAFFVASEFVFFAFLILAYVNFNHAYVTAGPTPSKALHVGTMFIWTVLLLSSSPTMWVASRSFSLGQRSRFRVWTLISIALGLAFLYGEGREYADLIGKGINLGSNVFASSFFALTGFHAFHVFIGLCLVSIVAGISYKGGLHGDQRPAVEAVSLYWHFVDAMWILIFSVVYLWSPAS